MTRVLVEEALGPYRLTAVPNGASRYAVHVLNASGESLDSDVVNLADAKDRAKFIEERIPSDARDAAPLVLLRIGARVDAARTLPARKRSSDPQATGAAYSDCTTPKDVLRRLNQEFAVVLVGDRPAVLCEGPDDAGRVSYRLLSMDGFAQWLRPYTILVGGKAVSIAKVWLEDEHRRHFKGLVFAPNQVVPDYYNLFRGFAVTPSPTGSCQRFLDHIFENVCDGDEKHFEWVMGWLAWIVQKPGKKSGTSLVLRGGMGVGKTIVGKTMGSLLGSHYSLVSESRYITGRFNSHLVDLLLLHLDEATWGGDHAAAGRLKDLVTGDWQYIEYKGREPVRVRNHVRVLVSGNTDWMIPAGLDERRFYVLDVADHQIQNHAYFGAIEAELDNGGREHLLHYLLNYDLTNVTVDRIASTSGLLDQKLASLNSMQQWWHDTLSAGVLSGDESGIGETPVNVLYAAYLDHARQTGQNRRAMETALGVFLRKSVPGLTKERRLMKSSTRLHVYTFPPLAECRQQWNKTMMGALDWDERNEGWAPFREPESGSGR